MLRKLLIGISGSSLLLAGCAQEGGGPLGFVLFDNTHHVAAAEPLFGKGEDRCLDSPAFLLSVLGAGGTAPAGAGNRPDPCAGLRDAIRGAMATPNPAPNNAQERYDLRQRNEVIDALMATSNRKCGRYTAFLQTYDANINTTFGIGALATAGLATVVGGENTAKALAGGSAFLNGTRSTFNEAHFRNRTIAVLAAAFDNARTQQRQAITNYQQCTPAQYTLMRGLEDAFRYHSTCSVVAGLDEAARAVQRANAPDLETIRKTMAEIVAMRQQFAAAEAPANPPPPGASGSPQTPQGTAGNRPVSGDDAAGEGTNPTTNGTGAVAGPATTGGAAAPALIAGASPTPPACPFPTPTSGGR
jgi:hypothetical protein